MVRPFRFALVALLLGAGLLLPVLLRGQAPEEAVTRPPGNPGEPVASQPWAPRTTTSSSNKPAVIASTVSRPAVPAPSPPSAPPPRRLPLPDDGLTLPRGTAPSAQATLRPVEARLPAQVQQPVPATPREPLPLPPALREANNLVAPPKGDGGLQLVTTGSAPGTSGSLKAVASTPGTPHTPAPQPSGPLSSVSNSVLSVELLGPAQVILDDIMPCELVVRNQGSQVLTDVRVDLPLPQGLRFVTAQPLPETHPDRLTWHLGVLEVRGERRLRTDLMAKATDAIALQPQASYQAGAAYRPEVVRPILSVSQVGPEVVPRGMTMTLQLRLTNHGSTPLQKVMLWDRLPAGLYHSQGSNIYAEVGQLAAGESRVITLDVIAHRAGRWVNEVVAEAEGVKKTISRTPILVAEPSLKVRVLGPDRVTVGGEVDYRLEISNGRQGPAAHNIRLTQKLPTGLELIQATTRGELDALNQRIGWQLGTLEPGQMQTVFVKARCLGPGSWTTQLTLAADQIAATQTEHTLLGEGGCRLTVQVQALEEALEVGSDTVYEVRLTNAGNEPVKNARISAWVPEGLAPLRAEGPHGGRIQQQHVLFESVPSLEARATSLYRIRVRGQRTGAWRMRVEAMAEQMARPILEEATIQVLPDPRTQNPPGVLKTLED